MSALLEGSKSSLIERIGCVTYLFLYGSFVMLVPTHLIAALMLVAWKALERSAVDGLSEPGQASETPTTTKARPVEGLSEPKQASETPSTTRWKEAPK